MFSANHMIVLTNTLDKTPFDFDSKGYERGINFIDKITIVNTDLIISRVECDRNDRNQILNTEEYVIKNADKYPALLLLLTGKLSPAEAAKIFGVKYMQIGLFCIGLDSKGKPVNKEHRLNPLISLLISFPRIKENDVQDKACLSLLRDSKVRVIDANLEVILKAIVFAENDTHDMAYLVDKHNNRPKSCVIL